MAEVQKTVQSGELTQRFIEFVMMTAQNAALFLGQIPNPKTGEPEVNLDLARMFIDQLEMIQEKTRGNLTNEETMVLRNTLCKFADGICRSLRWSATRACSRRRGRAGDRRTARSAGACAVTTGEQSGSGVSDQSSPV